MVTLFVFFWNTYGWKSVEMRVKLFKNWKHVFKLLYQTGPKSFEKCKPSNVWSLLVVPKAIWLTKNILFLTKYFTTKQTLLNVKKKKIHKERERWKLKRGKGNNCWSEEVSLQEMRERVILRFQEHYSHFLCSNGILIIL